MRNYAVFDVAFLMEGVTCWLYCFGIDNKKHGRGRRGNTGNTDEDKIFGSGFFYR
ncbi:MAG: hypothetical protein KJ592_04040 [Nanoarchaeota archaeon]|nr:hypothetical protein [Nanoarchaeota archaeon]